MSCTVTEIESSILRKALIASTELIDEGIFMTNQPEIKQYRRRVSDKSILKGAMRINALYDVNFDDCLNYARAALEAYADVIEAKPYDKIKGYMLLDYGGSVCDIEEIEQFNAEWEETQQQTIPSVG